MVDQPRFPHGYAPAVPAATQHPSSQDYIEINDEEGVDPSYEVASGNSRLAMEVCDSFLSPPRDLTVPRRMH